MQKMQGQVLRAQEELKKTEFEGTAGGGMVKVRMNGSQEVLGVDRRSLTPRMEMLEDLVVAAVKNAQEGRAERQRLRRPGRRPDAGAGLAAWWPLERLVGASACRPSAARAPGGWRCTRWSGPRGT
jgi:DNA-binding YbaB/EbfC family protein